MEWAFFELLREGVKDESKVPRIFLDVNYPGRGSFRLRETGCGKGKTQKKQEPGSSFPVTVKDDPARR